MVDIPRVLSFASTGVLALALSQGVAVAQQPTPAPAPIAPPPSAEAPAAVNPATAARDRAAERRAMWEEWQEQHDAMCEHMKKMTPEERRAQRESFWKERRARAAERGIDLPETPPWVADEQQRKAAQERYEQYRKTIEAMTEEQREAARAIFGSGGQRSHRPEWPMHQMPPMPYGGYPGYGQGPYGGPWPMEQPPMPYGQNAPEQAAPPPAAR